MKKRMYMISCFAVVSTFLIALTVASASAQLKKLTTEELTEGAEVVAVGKVSAMRSEWNKDRTRIYTKVTISVDQYVKGERVEKTLTITHLGGEVGDVGELYSGTPKFRKDEEVLVFVKKDKLGNLRVTGGARGKYTITKSELTGLKVLGENKILDDFTAQIKSIVKKQLKK